MEAFDDMMATLEKLSLEDALETTSLSIDALREKDENSECNSVLQLEQEAARDQVEFLMLFLIVFAIVMC